MVNETEGYDQYIKEGSIITQSPEAGTKAPAGTAVTIRISKGVENAKVRVPDIMRVDEMEATSLLIEAGLEPGAVSEVNHEDASLSGLVCYQSYSVGSFVEAGTVVDFSISLGNSSFTARSILMRPTSMGRCHSVFPGHVRQCGKPAHGIYLRQ